MPKIPKRKTKQQTNSKLPPQIRLAHITNAQGDNVLIGRNGISRMEDDSLPSLLISYYYLKKFVDNQHRYHYRDWVMDSGAFSAHNSGKDIQLKDYIECCKGLILNDPTLTEIFSLDVIGDYKGTKVNTEEMWRHDIPAIPCFHYGEPWTILKEYCEEYPKVAIGGCVGKMDKVKFAGQCFARQWPHKFHGFGFGSELGVLAFPWHSVDATSWETGPCGFGKWRSFDNAYLSVRGSSQNLRSEVLWYLDLEKRSREKWQKEMLLLEELYPIPPLYRGKGSKGTLPVSIRLAESGSATIGSIRTEMKLRSLKGREREREKD